MTSGCLAPTFPDINPEVLNSEREKKHLYNRRTLEVKLASFSTIHGAMCVECGTFVSKLSELLANKREKEICRNQP